MGILCVAPFPYVTNLHPRINLICTICGGIYDFDVGVSLHLDSVEKKLGFEMQDYRMEYYGVCAECKVLEKTGFQGRFLMVEHLVMKGGDIV